MRDGDAAGLRLGEPQRRRCGRLARQRRLVGVGGDRDEGDAQPLQQHPTVARRRGQNDAPGRRPGPAASGVLTVVFADIFDRILAIALLSNVFHWPARPRWRCATVGGRDGGRHGRAAGIGRSSRRLVRCLRPGAARASVVGAAGRRVSAASRRSAGRGWRYRGGLAGGSSEPRTFWADRRWKSASTESYRSYASAACSRFPGPSRNARWCCWHTTSASSRLSTTRTRNTRSCWRTGRLRRRCLIEDELLLTLPFAPRCERAACVGSPLFADAANERPAPAFAALAGLKKRTQRSRRIDGALAPMRAARTTIGEAHGCPAEQEVAVETRHASRAQFPGCPAARGGAGHRARCTGAITSARTGSTAARKSSRPRPTSRRTGAASERAVPAPVRPTRPRCRPSSR